MASNGNLEHWVQRVFNISSQSMSTPLFEKILDEIVDKNIKPEDLKPETLSFFLKSLDLGTLVGVKRGDQFGDYIDELSISYDHAVEECTDDILLSYFTAQEVLDQIPYEVKEAYVKHRMPELYMKPFMRKTKHIEKAIVMIGSAQWGEILYKPLRNVRARMAGR